MRSGTKSDYLERLSSGESMDLESVACSPRMISRDLALDVVKGVCVIVMVLYHSICYFPGSDLDTKYLAFVSAAFIFLAGFVATSIYLQKYDLRLQRGIIFMRLTTRGLKLILIAVGLNLVTMLLLGGGQCRQGAAMDVMLWNLLTGSDYHAASFVLLVAIGYCLFGIGVPLAVGGGRVIALVCTAVTAVIFAQVSNHYQWQGHYYVQLFAIGQVGAMVGLLKPGTVERLSSHLDLVLLLYFAQLLLAIMWPPCYLLYFLNVFCTLLAIYSIGSKLDYEYWLTKKMILLGKYSLLAYLFQIFFLQALRRLIPVHEGNVLVAFLLACVASLGCVEVVQWLRRRLSYFDSIYHFALG